MLDKRVEVYFECPECDNSFSQVFVEDYFEDEEDLEEVFENCENECPICGCEECVAYRYNFINV